MLVKNTWSLILIQIGLTKRNTSVSKFFNSEPEQVIKAAPWGTKYSVKQKPGYCGRTWVKLTVTMAWLRLLCSCMWVAAVVLQTICQHFTKRTTLALVKLPRQIQTFQQENGNKHAQRDKEKEISKAIISSDRWTHVNRHALTSAHEHTKRTRKFRYTYLSWFPLSSRVWISWKSCTTCRERSTHTEEQKTNK